MWLPAASDAYNGAMKSPPAYVRAIVACLFAPAITIFCVWLIRAAAVSAFQSSKAGRAARLIQQIAPNIERRDQQVNELTQP